MEKIQTQIRHDGIEHSVNREGVQHQIQNGIKTRKERRQLRLANVKKTVAGKAVNTVKNVGTAAKTVTLGGGNANNVSATKRTAANVVGKSFDAAEKVDLGVVEKKKPAAISVSKSFASKSAVELTSQYVSSKQLHTKKLRQKKVKLSNVKNTVANSTANTAKIAGSAGTIAVKTVEVIPSAGGSEDDVGASAASEIKRSTTDIADKSIGAVQNAVSSVADKVKFTSQLSAQHMFVRQIKAKKLKLLSIRNAKSINPVLHSSRKLGAVKQKITKSLSQKAKYSAQIHITTIAKIKGKIKSIKKLKTKGKKKYISGAAAKAVSAVSSTSALAQKTSDVLSSNDRGTQVDTGGDLSHTVRNSVEKATNKSVESVRKVSGRVRKTVKKAANPTGRTLQKAQKRTIKKTAQTTAKTAKKTAKAAAKTAQKNAEATAKAAKTSAQLSAKIISAIAEAVGAIAASPVGLVILIVAVVIVLIILVMNLISGSIGSVAGTVAPAMSSLEWLFGDTQSNDWDELTEKYQEYIEMADSAFDELTGFAGGLSFGERDTLVFNGAEFYPASSGLYYVQQSISNMTFDDVYFVQLYYIYMLRYNDEPEMTQEGMYDFMYNLYFDISVTTTGGYACPTADCTTTTWSHTSGYCPDVGEGEDCPGHETPYCPHNHKRITVTFSARPDITDFLNFTDDELEMLDLGYMTLLSMFATEDG